MGIIILDFRVLVFTGVFKGNFPLSRNTNALTFPTQLLTDSIFTVVTELQEHVEAMYPAKTYMPCHPSS